MKKIDLILEKMISTMTISLYISLIVVVFIQIVARYTSLTTPWSDELSRFIFIYMISLGGAMSLKYNQFADVDLLFQKFNNTVKKIVYVINFFLIFIFNIVLLVSSFKFMIVGLKSQSAVLKVPMVLMFLSMFILAFFSVIYCIYLLLKIKKDSKKAIYDFENGGLE
ncbi:MAG: TRAP transporter small permease subunit [Tissierellia bacterium]|nr:TRAP transporter small permease subunit [Tissierellia bacterium]